MKRRVGDWAVVVTVVTVVVVVVVVTIPLQEARAIVFSYLLFPSHYSTKYEW